MSSKLYNRKISFKKAIRKYKLDKELTPAGFSLLYDNLHQYSKNKIHCSCRMCSPKTRNKGHRRQRYANYAPCINYSYSDLKKVIKMQHDLDEYYNI